MGTIRIGRIGALTIALAGLALGTATVGSAAAANGSTSPCPNQAFRVGPSASLPDCRAYEQVSPTEKNGYVAYNEGYPSQASPNGDAFAYLSFGVFAGAPSGSFPNGYVSRRGADGWQTTSVSPPNPDPTPPGGIPTGYDYSPDLTQRMVNVAVQSIAEGAPATVQNLFRFDGGSYTWVNHMAPPITLPGECPIPSSGVGCWQFVDVLGFAGASEDFDHVLFELRPSRLEAREDLYLSNFEGGTWHVSPAGILPDGQPAAEGATAGSGSSALYTSLNAFQGGRVAHAISADGSRVTFQAAADEGEPGEAGQKGMTEVYQRTDGTQTVELSAPAAGATPANPAPKPATFWAASRDGQRVFFTSSAELTSDANTGPANEGVDLYEYDSTGAAPVLTDLTADPTGAGAEVLGVVDASEDGSYVYVVARGELVPGEGEAGKPNLYVVHAGAPTFIATLKEGTAAAGGDAGDWPEKEAAMRESYVTPDGLHVAFTSFASLSTANFPGGYDNTNPSTAKPEPEVYEYSVPDGELVCASCDPSGAPPVSPGLLGGVRRPQGKGFTQSSPFHLVRSVSDDGGRVFFTSGDPLVAAVPGSNTVGKVYEYEHQGEGSCATAGGCVSLLSGPTGEKEAIFMDAGENGNDVFVGSFDRLAGTDQDGLADVYDARVEGGRAEAPPVAPCTGDSCRGAGSQAPASGGNGTGSFQGPGNLKPKHRKPCPKGKVRRGKRCVRKARRHRHHRHHRRHRAKSSQGAGR